MDARVAVFYKKDQEYMSHTITCKFCGVAQVAELEDATSLRLVGKP